MKNKSASKVWSIYLSTGELFAKLTFTRDELVAFFPGAKIGRTRVYLV